MFNLDLIFIFENISLGTFTVGQTLSRHRSQRFGPVVAAAQHADARRIPFSRPACKCIATLQQ